MTPPVLESERLADFTTRPRVLLLCLMSVVIGAFAAVVAYALVWLINVFTNLAFFGRFSAGPASPGSTPYVALILLVPAAGGLVIGLLARYGSDRIRGHGIPEALEAILIGRSRMQLKVAVLKPLSSAISIGTGGPFGAEGPIIMTGGAVGSLFAQLFHLSSAERKTLLVAGAAGGMAAIFVAPIASVLLAVELLLFEWKPRSFIPVACAAMVGAALRVPLLGAGPIFPVTPHAMVGAGVLGLAVLVGLCAGAASSLLTLLVYGFEDLFARLPFHWMWWPAIGGLAVGVAGVFDPRILGIGYDLIHGLLAGQLNAPGGLLLLKALAWAVALGSGTSGGVLAPLLIIGGALGALLGPILPGGDAGLWAQVGMAAIMGGTMRAPFTSILFVVELTHDLNTLPALLAGAVAAEVVTVLVLRRSILTEKIARRGLHLTREYSVDPLELVRVGDVMDREPPTIPATMTLGDLAARIASGDRAVTRRQALLMVDDVGTLVGIITRGDVLRALGAGADATRMVIEFGETNTVFAYPDQTVRSAADKMLVRDIGRLPVVAPDGSGRVVGYFGRAAVLVARKRVLDEENVRERVARPRLVGSRRP